MYVAAGTAGIYLLGGAGNDWLGANGDGHHSLSGGDGDDWIGATGILCTLFGEGGNDTVFAAGSHSIC